MEKNRLYLLAGILVLLVVVAYFLTKSDQRTSTDEVGKKLYELDSAAIDRIEITQDGKKIAMKNDGGMWTLVEPVTYNVNQEFVGSLLSDLKNYEVLSVVSKNPENKKDFGLDDSAKVLVTVFQNGNIAGTFEVGKTPDAPNQTYITIPGKDEVYLAKNFLKNNFVRPTLESWRDLKIISIPSANVKSLEFQSGGSTYIVTKEPTGSFLVDGSPADSLAVNGVLNLLQDFNTQSFKDTVLGPGTQFTDKVIVKTGENVTELDFLRTGDSTSVNYLLKIAGKDQIFLFNEGLAINILKTKSELLKK
jgi:hypothetical protein